MATEKATFGAGCFWGVEDAFRKTDGVVSTRVGYAGGESENPTYKQVCSGSTGHAEVTEVEFDPEIASYEHLLDVFWKIHDPTQLNRQGPDYGSQYRSVIFGHDEGQLEAARTSMAVQNESGRHRRQIVTLIEPAPTFYPAEDYHQQYFEKTGRSGCHI
ncbi:peptide-methionine (S)-S-oxide reductase MsrA [Stratiformator vulcanicus]|uniref:Peptide methionine sulfoxide reductase MsrA n=1 Tax=Stratiformator vulcanicus TaxID=2527980 RepID=A0A517R6Y5_9PLAN|nr:peptide-methionine (S)-S-oxide reductase MsrA [Stratiformator vulcanicus]QDT39639.1 Peptide methionine sulfoxide reductase MsrA [Stratiformator vulcanicus]